MYSKRLTAGSAVIMRVPLSVSQITKYAGRLQGKRLLPFLREWQIKRAIRRLANDGSTRSLDAIKQSMKVVVLGLPPLSELVGDVLDHSVDQEVARRVWRHLAPQKPSQQENQPRGVDSQNRESRKPLAQPLPPPPPPPPQSLYASSSEINKPIQRLQRYLSASAPLESFREEFRDRVLCDDDRALLQEICELWDKANGTLKKTLAELIEFIGQAPERPPWLRRNVALDCQLPWLLADDGPAMAKYLVDPIQLRTRKSSIINAVKLLRRDDTKQEICTLWYIEYKRGSNDALFNELLLEQGFLPDRPYDQRVAIALTCGWIDRLADDSEEVIPSIFAFFDHPQLAAEAQRAADGFRNPLTIKALNAHYKTLWDTKEKKEQIEEDNSNTYQRLQYDLAGPQGKLSESDRENIVNLKEKDHIVYAEIGTDTPNKITDSDTTLSDTLSQQHEFDGTQAASRPHIPSSEFDSYAKDEDKTGSAQQIATADVTSDDSVRQREEKLNIGSLPSRREAFADFINDAPEDFYYEQFSFWLSDSLNDEDPDAPWISQVDKIASLSPEERSKIIDYIANIGANDEQWIVDLLSEAPEYQPRYDHALDHQLREGSNSAFSHETNNDSPLELLYKHENVEVGIDVYASTDEEKLPIDRRTDVSDLAHLSDLEQDESTSKAEPENSEDDAQSNSYLDILSLTKSAQESRDSASISLIDYAKDILVEKKEDHLSRFRYLIAGLLTFHVRERDAELLAYEEHLEMNEDALFNDSDCISSANLQDVTPYTDGIIAARYKFNPQQPFRFTNPKGSSKTKLVCQASRIGVELESIEIIHGVVTLLVKASMQNKLERKANFIHVPQDFGQSLRANLAQQAPGWVMELATLPRAFSHLLLNQGSEDIFSLNDSIDESPDQTAAAIASYLNRADGLSLVLQGPPGSGKTSCAANIIALLARSGSKIGVSANSHLAIDTLLEKIVIAGDNQSTSIRVVKYLSRVNRVDRETLEAKGIHAVSSSNFNLLFDVCGGTAFQFSKARFEDLFDLLVIDEASQLSLASLLAMSRCARNLLLVGDQQQLAQPIMASHPLGSGLSCLGYATSGHQIVPRNIGIFLSKSWRLHPTVCKYISSTFYEGCLQSHQNNEINRVSHAAQQEVMKNEYPSVSKTIAKDILNSRLAKELDEARAELASTGNKSISSGIIYVPVPHERNNVLASEEAEAIREICNHLIGKECCLCVGGKVVHRQLTWNDILVVSPYNAQVSLIQRVLGPAARVGTVDRFQGQEAPISIYSITTSSPDSQSNLEFVLNRNRINVAISRSQCLSIVVGSPSLVGILNSSQELQDERNLFFSLTHFIGPMSSICGVNVGSMDADSSDIAAVSSGVELSQLLGGAELSVPMPVELEDMASIALARKLFKFDLSSDDIRRLYQYRLFDELALFLDYCRWDTTEKAWERTKKLLRIGESSTATPLVLEKLANRGDGQIRQAVASNPMAPLDVVRCLITPENIMGRRGAAVNPSLPEDIYANLLLDSDEMISRGLAANPGLPTHMLHHLTNSPCDLTSRHAKESLAKKASRTPTTEDDLDARRALLNRDGNPLLSLALDPRSTSDQLSALLSSSNQKVRTALAGNPALPLDVMHVLAFDSNDAVRCELANRPDLPANLTKVLAHDRSRFVRRNLASNSACSEEALKRLISDQDVYVRENVARLDSLSIDICKWIMCDSDDRVIFALADNTAIPRSSFASVQAQYYYDCLSGEKENAVKALLLIHPNLPVGQLGGICLELDARIRLALVLSPHVKAETLRSLLDDEEPFVRRTAKQRLDLADQ